MMDSYTTHRRNGLNLMRDGTKEIDPPGHATDLFTGWAVDYLDERAKAGGPFLLYLAYNAPHDPLQPPADWLAKVTAREPGLPAARAKLVALIEHMDDGIGNVLAALDRTGLAKNTVVIFTSDNGGVTGYGANNGPWRSGKQHVYEGGLRVPGVVRWPGVVKSGSRTDRLTLTMDIFPTVCGVAGVEPPKGIDGVSFLPTLCGQQELVADREVYFVRREGGSAYGGKTIEAVRRGKWKLVQDSPFAPPELYDLEADPGKRPTSRGRRSRCWPTYRPRCGSTFNRAGGCRGSRPNADPVATGSKPGRGVGQPEGRAGLPAARVGPRAPGAVRRGVNRGCRARKARSDRNPAVDSKSTFWNRAIGRKWSGTPGGATGNSSGTGRSVGTDRREGSGMGAAPGHREYRRAVETITANYGAAAGLGSVQGLFRVRIRHKLPGTPRRFRNGTPRPPMPV